jgi:Outer membrane protein beta-barrel domain
MKHSIGFVVFGLIFAISEPALAQGFGIGIGPRLTVQPGKDGSPNSTSLRLFGGQFKMHLTPKTAIELSADYETRTNETLSERAKTMPIQASVMYFPVRSVVSPYVLGGVGWFRHELTTTQGAPAATLTSSVREMGYHAGLGAEVRINRRVTIHGDYRYTHIRFGSSGQPEQQPASTANIPATVAAVSTLMPKLSAVQQSLKTASQGSIWNWGVTFFF